MKTNVARDKYGKIMWIKGKTNLSPLTYREWREGYNMPEPGKIIKNLGFVKITFYAPFFITEEDVK